MNSLLRLRLLTHEDLPFADSVRALAGWNQTLEDWKRFLKTEPTGCFLAEWNGAPAGTATTTIYGPELAWLGMVLVHPEYRRRGIGQALLERCIEYLRGRGVRCIKLDATPLGRTVYRSLGFCDEWTLTRWECAEWPARPPMTDNRIRRWVESDLANIERLDSKAFGVPRTRIVLALAQQSRSFLVLESESDQITGYGLLRPGAQAFYLGPVVAMSAETALCLAEALLARSGGERIFWDVPDQNAAIVAWARQHGFTRQRSLTRMALGENSTTGDPQQQCALAGPELG